jgi:hypothetical protein
VSGDRDALALILNNSRQRISEDPATRRLT